MSRFGYSIRILRQARGYTGAQLAERAGISPAYLSLIEKDERLPADVVLASLAEALDVDTELLLGLLPDSHSRAQSRRVRDLGLSLKRLADAEDELKRKLG